MVETLSVMKIAKHLGVAPWELLNVPAYWYEMGSLAVAVENAQYEKARKADKKVSK